MDLVKQDTGDISNTHNKNNKLHKHIFVNSQYANYVNPVIKVLPNQK